MTMNEINTLAGLGYSQQHRAIEAVQARIVATKVKNEAKIVAAILAAVAAQRIANPFARLTIAGIVETLKLNVDQVHAVLARMAMARKIELGPWTECVAACPSPECLLPMFREFKFFVR